MKNACFIVAFFFRLFTILCFLKNRHNCWSVRTLDICIRAYYGRLALLKVVITFNDALQDTLPVITWYAIFTIRPKCQQRTAIFAECEVSLSRFLLISNRSSTAYFKKTNSYWLFVQVTYGIIVLNALAVVTERLRIITRDTGKCYCLRTYLSWFIQCKINFRIYHIWSSFYYEIVNCQIWMIYLFIYLFILTVSSSV